jgi:hypothetical protein
MTTSERFDSGIEATAQGDVCNVFDRTFKIVDGSVSKKTGDRLKALSSNSALQRTGSA